MMHFFLVFCSHTVIFIFIPCLAIDAVAVVRLLLHLCICLQIKTIRSYSRNRASAQAANRAHLFPEVFISQMTCLQHSLPELTAALQRFPHKLTREQFYPCAYHYMFLARQMDLKFKELFRKGYVKGTVIIASGNEATAVGMSMPFRPGRDVLSLLHRDLGAHLTQGVLPLEIMCQFMANENSPTHGREGNVHFGNVAERRFPMISHLGDMLPLTVGGVWGARRRGEDVMGLAVIGDGGTSTGDFHEALNIASVRTVPVLFLIQNNLYAYSTPIKYQYNCERLSDRAAAYGIKGTTVDGTDAWEVYNAVCDALAGMQQDAKPRILECMTVRLEGHAAYDKAEYISSDERSEWLKREPVMLARQALATCGYSEEQIFSLEERVNAYVTAATQEALAYGRPSPKLHCGAVFARSQSHPKLPVFALDRARNLNAVTAALDYLMEHNPTMTIVGQDVGVYGSAFKSCKGLFEKYGADRVIDMPIAESATAGFCLGASQTGIKPVMEFQFADFSTEAVTQIGLNAGTWFFRTEQPAQILFRLPCGGGITLGAFHSGEFEGLWSRFPGLKLFYPVTPQETFEAMVAAFYDPNPSLIFEHKLLYSGRQETIAFDGICEGLIRPRRYTDGTELTIVALGASVEACLAVVKKYNYSAAVWNPFILNPLQAGPLIESVRKTGRLLVVQESGETAGLGDRIISVICRDSFEHLTCPPRLVCTPDTPIPFAKELEVVCLPGIDRIHQEIVTMIGEKCE